MKIQYLEDYCTPGNEYSGDAFFLDTNYLIAFVNTKHPHHISTLIHTIFLLHKNAKLYISETVLSEAIDVLARAFFEEEKFREWKESDEHTRWLNNHTGTKTEYNAKKDEIRSLFINDIVKNHENPDLLSKYNAKATDILSSIVESRFFRLSNTSFSVLLSGMDFAKTVPLQSNDALIAAAAISKSSNILTFDSDFKRAHIINPETNKEIECFTAKIPNNYYLGRNRALNRIYELDPNLKAVIEQVLGGSAEFSTKFQIPLDPH